MGNSLGLLITGATNQRDAWAEIMNKVEPYSFNTAKSPYDVWNGKYSAIRPRGATYAHPEGIDAAFEKANSGILGLFDKE